MPRLFIGADHRGFTEKQRLVNVLHQAAVTQGYEVVDLGAPTLKPDDDFNDSAIAVARAVRDNKDSLGILICGSAHGISMQANRFKGVRAICGYTPELVKLGRMHNDANVLCLSADFMDANIIDHAIAMFVTTQFLPEERYIRRNHRLDEEVSY